MRRRFLAAALGMSMAVSMMTGCSKTDDKKETTASTKAEVQTEKATEAKSEAQTEKATEAKSEEETEKATEAKSEEETEQATEVQSEEETEQATEVQSEEETEQATEVQSEEETEQATEAKSEEETEQATEVQSEEETEQATEAKSETDETEEASSEEASSEAETEAFDYSEGYDEKGFFEGISALDYVTLPDYSTIEVPDSVVPSDETVQAQIDSTLNSYATKNQITDEDRLIEDGDTVNIDYVGSVDGVEFEGGSTEGNGTTVTIGVTQYIDGFLDQLIGHAPGENFDINVTFPDPYTNNEDLSGKEAVFNITINYIEETVVPELDDDFVAENLSDYESADAYRQSVYDSLYKQNLFNELSEYLVTNSEFSEIPESVADTIYNERYERYSYYAQMYGMDMDSFLAANGLDEDSFRDMWTDYTKACLAYQAVMEDAGWEMSVDDAKEQLGFDDTAYDNAVTNFGEPYVLSVAMQSYVLDKLGDNVTLVKAEESSEEASSEAVSEEASSEEESSEEASSEEVSTEEASSKAK